MTLASLNAAQQAWTPSVPLLDTRIPGTLATATFALG